MILSWSNYIGEYIILYRNFNLNDHINFIVSIHLNTTLSMLTCEYKQVINYEEHLNTIIIFLIITCCVEAYGHTCVQERM